MREGFLCGILGQGKGGGGGACRTWFAVSFPKRSQSGSTT